MAKHEKTGFNGSDGPNLRLSASRVISVKKQPFAKEPAWQNMRKQESTDSTGRISDFRFLISGFRFLSPETAVR